PGEVGFAGRRAVEGDVADDDVFIRDKFGRSVLRRIDDDPRAADPFADVVVGVALEFERHATWTERAETLAGRSIELQMDGAVREPLRTMAAADLGAGDGADDPVDIDDRKLGFDLFAFLDRRAADFEQA